MFLPFILFILLISVYFFLYRSWFMHSYVFEA
jgi:hypothetical protein